FYVLGLKYHVHGIDRSHTAVCEAHRADINADTVNTRQRAQINPCALCPRKRTSGSSFKARWGSNTAARGRMILISVNSPGCVTTLSWLMERPRPVPSPAGFVVKKGLNIFSFTSDSEQRCAWYCLRCGRLACDEGSVGDRPPFGLPEMPVASGTSRLSCGKPR